MALIIAVSLTSLLSAQRMIGLSSNVERSQNVLLELNRMISYLKDVETGARGYAITSDRRQLVPYQTGVARFNSTIGRLRDMAGTGTPMAGRIQLLNALGQTRISLSQELVRRADDLDRASLAAMVNDGSRTMERIRREVDVIIAEERAAYNARSESLERQSWLTNAAMAVGIALSLIAIVWLFALQWREVSRRQRAEAELRQLNAELEERVEARTVDLERSRELLNAVIENMPDTVFLKDAADQYRYVLVNEAAEKFLGRDRSDVLGRVDHELFPRREATLCRREDEEVDRSGRARIAPEHPLTTSLGVRMVESRKVPVQLDHGDQRFVLGILRDVTEQKALENQVREMQRMDALGRLTGGIAHDFNNLLAIIMGNIELLRDRVDNGSDAADISDEALSATTRGAELVRRLLAFARKQHLEPRALDLNERLPDVTPLLQRTLGETIHVQVKPATNLWPALVDPTQVDDALVNLAINARDAMPGGGSLTIETDNVVLDEDYAAHHVEVTPGQYVMLAVSDTGTGMTPETIARAFEPFFTTKPEGRGNGLGLSQVYGWVKQSGGHIKIYSEVGHGTTIKLYLPRAGAEEGKASGGAENGSASAGGHETILVVEDNPNVRRTTVRQLASLGYATIEAEDGREALDMVTSGARFDLLLTDVVMPGGLSGYELADEVAKIRPDVKVLFTSGYTELAESAREAPRTRPLLSKPYRKRELGLAIRSILDDGD